MSHISLIIAKWPKRHLNLQHPLIFKRTNVLVVEKMRVERVELATLRFVTPRAFGHAWLLFRREPDWLSFFQWEQNWTLCGHKLSMDISLFFLWLTWFRPEETRESDDRRQRGDTSPQQQAMPESASSLVRSQTLLPHYANMKEKWLDYILWLTKETHWLY